MILHHFHNDFEKIGMFFLPFSFATLLQVPSVNDIAVHNKRITIHCTQEISKFSCLGMFCAQMNIRDNYGRIKFLCIHMLLIFDTK